MSESFSINQTKPTRPDLPADFVQNPQLLEQLTEWQRTPLTLISAPADYGKTTWVSGWLETVDVPNVWITLDEHDDDMIRFLTHFLAAIRAIFPDALEDTLALINASELPSVPALANSLVSDLNQITADYVLVLDNYQSMEQMAVHDLLSALLLDSPPSMHLILCTRFDPPLDLTNLRAQNRIIEIRARELGLKQAEATE